MVRDYEERAYNGCQEDRDPRTKNWKTAFDPKICWEVEVIPPTELEQILNEAIVDHIDVDKLNAAKAVDEQKKANIRASLEKVLL
jgi:hypothetical protein